MTTSDEITSALDTQLIVLENMATTALHDLNAAETRAQQLLSDIEARVALGQMGAELVPLLTDAIAAAKQTRTDIEESLTGIQDSMSTLQEVIAATPILPEA